MKPERRSILVALLVAIVALVANQTMEDLSAAPFPSNCNPNQGHASQPIVVVGEPQQVEEIGGTWYWLRSPDEEKRFVMSVFTKYCIRCHGIDGRGVWDIPDVPNFTNVRWQSSRTEGQIARRILEGRGAVMPPFRGTLSLEEAWAMARYIRTFIPGAEKSRPDYGEPEKPKTPPATPEPPKPAPPKPPSPSKDGK
jgi:hypothetical protein